MDLKETEYESADCIHLIVDSFQCLCVGNTLMNYRVAYKTGTF
jgi:hypothetical protein